MTAKQRYLAVDLGAESGRVVAGNFDGNTVQLDELHRFSNGPVHLAGTMRWDVLRLWSEIQEGLKKAAADDAEGSIVSVGVDSWGVDYVLMNRADEMLGQPYHYRDSRSDGMLATATSRVPRSEIFAASGLQFMEINTLYQLMAMQQSDPSLLAQADRFLMIADFFHWCLSGSRVVEFTNATTTQCFDAGSGAWAHDLLRRLDVPSQMFPDVVPPGTQLGALRGDVAESTGLSRIQVVAPATHDTGSAVAAVPSELTGTARWAYISSGTWSLIGVEVPAAIRTDRALEFNVTNEGGIDGTYRLLKNVMGLWLVQQCRTSLGRKGAAPTYAELVNAAEQAPAFRSLVDPDDASFLKPDDMPSALQAWCRRTDQHAPETTGELVRCALESLALKYRVVLGQIEELTGTPVEVIHIVGGGSQNELLNQFTANACGRPVVAGPVEATALGNVLIQARAAGEIGSLGEIRQVVRNSIQLKQYGPQNRAAWQAAAERFDQLRIAAQGN